MLDNATRWMSSGSSRLLKAKSSPNISKMSSSNNRETNLRSKNSSRLNDSITMNSNNKSRVSRSTSRTPCKGEQHTTSQRVASLSPNIVDPLKTRGPVLNKNRRAISESPIIKATSSQKNDKKKLLVKTSVSSSCTILEDRSLLKKGLTYAPAKLPRKPEVLRKNLDRSISLMNVPKETSSLVVQEPNEKSKKNEGIKKRQNMNRSISMWNVQSTLKMDAYSNNQSRKLCSKPSKIPLLAGRISKLGRSLADLSQVDRSGGESTLFRFTKMNVVDVEQQDLDRSIDERIYENCRETIGDKVLQKEEDESFPPIGINLEERAACLMAQLDDDENDDDEATTVVEEEIEKVIDSIDRVDGIVKNKGKSKNQRIEQTEGIEDDSENNDTKLSEINKKKMKETMIEKEISGNIKELRCNWEQRQTRDIQVEKEEIKKIQISNDTPDSKRKLLGKRAKEIEHLVNFFNCKNAESTPRNENLRDSWIKSKNNVVPPGGNYSSIESSLKKKARESKNACEYNGYASDGNCSEDSGHISNENEVEWKDGGQSEQIRNSFEKERESFFPNEVDRTIQVFDSTPHTLRTFVSLEKKEIVMVTKNNPLASSIEATSRIDSCREHVPKTINEYEIPTRSTYSTGSNVAKQIFFRSGTLERLEAQRDEKLTGHIILLQARCRGYLARRKLNTLKLQDLAVRCIQRNVRKLMSVREWPWWRLYVKVAPLLNVHRTEDQLKARTEELEVLRVKVERLEQERNHLKHDNDKLEAKVTSLEKQACKNMLSVPSSAFSESMTSKSHNLLESSNVDGLSTRQEKKDDSIGRHMVDYPSSSKSLGNLSRRPPLPPIVNYMKRSNSRLQLINTLNSTTRSPSPSSSLSSSLSYHARSTTRSPSSASSRAYSYLDSSKSLSLPPRRTFPRESSAVSLVNEDDVALKEQAPVVFDASLNFVLGCDKQRVKQSFTPMASHLEPSTASSHLSNRISQFLKRTDHIMDEWRSLGHKVDLEENCVSLSNNLRDTSRTFMGRSQSATNIMIKGYQYFSRSTSRTKNLSSRQSISRASEDRTLSDGPGNELSEMTADFAEEHSTSTLAAERIDAETSERLRLERELQDVTEANKNLQQTTERLEMELLYARAADLNGVASDGEDGEDGGVYRQRYEHAVRELEFTKRKMAQQHEDDLEQLVGLKKQLEKKLADAYEEVEEQRQVVGQWKRRVQKLNGEMHDLRLLLEEQTARNNLLEKKQRKFDSETQNLMNDLRQEKAQRERLAREKEIAIAEKFTIEQNLSDAKLEIELKEERLRTLSQELEELTFGGKTEEEVAQLKKAKHELEKRSKDQEEELDDLAGQVQLLEQAKLRLEMSIEQQRKEMRKEMQQRDEELEDVRGNALKKVKALESQLENEHEERTILLREKHELERRLVAIEEQDRADRAADAEMTQRLKRDLKRTRALLRDAQTMLERSKGDSTGKAALRQLKNQLEDAECARAAAVKAKQALEQELNETQATLEEATRQRSEAEDRANAANRERSELLSQLEENEEELAEVLKKYRAAVQQVSVEQAQLQEAQVQIGALEAEKSSLKDQLSELSQRLESVEQLGDPTANSLATRRLEFRTKELESKLELEQTTRARLETQITRLKESVEKLQTETALLRTKEQTAQDTTRRLQRSLRDAREEASSALAREQEATRARRELEKSLEAAEAETKLARDDLRLALQRIDDLQSAIQGELDLDCSEEATSENSDRALSDFESEKDEEEPVYRKEFVRCSDRASSSNETKMKENCRIKFLDTRTETNCE
ncbi:hypothetical protein M0802_008946 [Mischocyttarus mexicanus]|nr:hypothetical protein M0802_008946 [Mischocyttarus mexicanus]